MQRRRTAWKVYPTLEWMSIGTADGVTAASGYNPYRERFFGFLLHLIFQTQKQYPADICLKFLQPGAVPQGFLFERFRKIPGIPPFPCTQAGDNP